MIKKIFICFWLILPVFAAYAQNNQVGDVIINEENFPDENFRNHLLEQDYGADGVITDEEIAEITIMNVGQKSISDLTGIKYSCSGIFELCQQSTYRT